MVIRTSDRIRFSARSLNHGLFNPSTLRHRRFDGFIASMQQSGSQWIKYMLSLMLAKLYNLPPAQMQDDSIVGHPKSPPIYTQIPQIVHSHSIPHYLLQSRTLLRLFHFPKHLILVRDLRDALVSHYEKRKSGYNNVDFSTFLRGDVRGKEYMHDIWVRIRFLNGWGAVVERHPEHAAVFKYEDLLADTRGQLARVCDHFNIRGVTPELLDEVVAAASKAEMAKLQNPNPKWTVVRMDPRPPDEWYSDEDRRFFVEVCRRHLKYTFGYEYW